MKIPKKKCKKRYKKGSEYTYQKLHAYAHTRTHTQDWLAL